MLTRSNILLHSICGPLLRRRWTSGVCDEPAKNTPVKTGGGAAKNTALSSKKRLFLGLASCPPNLAAIKLWFFWGTAFDQHQQFDLDTANDILLHPEFRPQQPTVLYVHGYVERMTDESQLTVVDAYQRRGDHNLLLLDWSALAEGHYFLDALPNSKQVATSMATALLRMCGIGGEKCELNGRCPVHCVHLVGHSMGAHIAGQIGRCVQGRTCGTTVLKRITGLDPAFPGFYPGRSHLRRTDARMVDVIHTDAWLYGAPFATGTVDFWPNRGRSLQPGCPKRDYKRMSDNDLCCHHRSWRYWAESVAGGGGRGSEPTSKPLPNSDCFAAVRATSWKAFQAGQMDWSVTNMGIDCATGSTGNYYLQTNGEAPFSRGMQGIMYADANGRNAASHGKSGGVLDIEKC